MRISDWSSDVCSSDLPLSLCCKACLATSLRGASTGLHVGRWDSVTKPLERASDVCRIVRTWKGGIRHSPCCILAARDGAFEPVHAGLALIGGGLPAAVLCKRSEEHTSELQSLMRTS